MPRHWVQLRVLAGKGYVIYPLAKLTIESAIVGYDCENHLPKRTRIADVSEFLRILGYELMTTPSRKAPSLGITWYYFKERDFDSRSGISATISTQKDGAVLVHTHTQIHCSKHDNEFMNLTIRQLKKRFGGFFVSDFGKGRYIRFQGIERHKAEAGCFLAFGRFQFSLIKLKIYLMRRDFKGEDWKETGKLDIMDEVNPAILANNMVVPYLVSCIEEFFEWTFIALLTYSPKRLQVLRSLRLTGDHLAAIASGNSIEVAVARALSFQNLSNASSHFKLVDDKLDIAAALRKPYRRRRRSLYETIQELIDRRHRFIHSNTVDSSYSTERLERDLNDLEAGVARVYKSVAQHYNWVYDPDS